jgi:hypothetical protein
MFSKNLAKHLKGFSSGFTELHAKLVADAFLHFAILRRQKQQEVEKELMFTALCHMAGWCSKLEVCT